MYHIFIDNGEYHVTEVSWVKWENMLWNRVDEKDATAINFNNAMYAVNKPIKGLGFAEVTYIKDVYDAETGQWSDPAYAEWLENQKNNPTEPEPEQPKVYTNMEITEMLNALLNGE